MVVVNPCGADRATSMAISWVENPTGEDRLLLKHQLCPTEDNGVDFMRVQSHYYRVQQVELYHHLG